MLVALNTPIAISGRVVEGIELRPPGRQAFEAMRAARGPLGFTEAAAARFGARLSEHTEPTIRRLDAVDLAALTRALDELYRAARRRFVADRRANREAGD